MLGTVKTSKGALDSSPDLKKLALLFLFYFPFLSPLYQVSKEFEAVY